MLRIRRLYFYLILYVSLSMLLVGLATLLRVLLERVLTVPSTGLFGLFVGYEQVREQTALGIALVVIGLPVWLLHWRVVHGWLAGPLGTDDRASALRRLYLYAVLMTTGLATYLAGRDLLERLLALALGQVSGTARLAGVTGTLPFAVVAAMFWLYHWRIAAADRRVVGERGASATLRRWYLYPMLVLGVLPLMVNLASVGQRLWEVALDPNGLDAPFGQLALARTLASTGATILLALPVWLGHQAWSQAMVAVPTWHGESERGSLLRKVYLYGLVLVTVAWALVNASEILRFGVASVLGVAPDSIGGTPIVVALGAPLASVLVFGLFWVLYWRAVSREAVSQAEVGEQAGVRRLYFYLVSAVALGFLAWSLASLLRMAADLLLQPAAVDPAATRGELARNVSWLLVGLPVWLFHWSRSQALATGERGAEETRSMTRRWYLYVVAFAGAAVLLYSGGRVVYELVLVGLGRAADAEVAGSLSDAMMDAVVAGSILWYHWFLVLRADLAALRESARARVAVAVVAGLDAASAARLEELVRTSLDGARTRLYWTDQAHAREVVAKALEQEGRATIV